MKILILADDFPPKAYGGAGGVAFNVARGMVKKGYNVCVITSVRKSEEVGEIMLEGIKIYSFQSSYHERWRAYRSLYNPKGVSFVKKILEKEKPNIVHAHNIHEHISYHSLKLAKKSGAKVILTAHDCMLFHYGKFTDFIFTHTYHVTAWSQLRTFRLRYNPFRNILIEYYLKYVDVLTAVSFELKKALDANGIKNIEVVHNAIDTSLWKSHPMKTQNFLRENNLESYNKVLFAGKLTKAKGGEELIEALKNLKNTALIIVGQKDSYTTGLVSQAEKSGIKVVITGWKNENELPDIYATADVVAFPSICFDTFGMVNLEGMICSKPVIASTFGGAKEVVVDNETGFIINPFETEDFSKKLNLLFENKELAQKMGESGYKRVIENFDISKQIREYDVVYKK